MNRFSRSGIIGLASAAFLSACGNTAPELAQTQASNAEINPRSSYVLPADGRGSAVTCQGISGTTTLRTVRISGGRNANAINPTFAELATKFSMNIDARFTSSKDAWVSGGVTPNGRFAFINNTAGQAVAVINYNQAMIEALKETRYWTGINSRSYIETELITPGQRPTTEYEKIFNVQNGTSGFTALFAAIFGPIGLRGGEFPVPKFILVLEQSKGYAAGTGYLFASNQITESINATYFESKGVGLLNTADVFGKFDCRVNRLQ
jgi:hypothetical protein